MIFFGVALAVVGLAAPAAATVLWANEQVMLGANPYRFSYILDVGLRAITYEDFASPAVTAFYTDPHNGFDRNFMYWAPIVAIDPPHETWRVMRNPSCLESAGAD